MTETEKTLFYLAAINYYRARYAEEASDSALLPEAIIHCTERKSGVIVPDAEKKEMIAKLKEEIADKA